MSIYIYRYSRSEVQNTFAVFFTACSLAVLKLLAVAFDLRRDGLGLRRSGQLRRPQLASNPCRWSRLGGRRSADESLGNLKYRPLKEFLGNTAAISKIYPITGGDSGRTFRELSCR
jgi:hypothetical protein